MKDRMQDFFYMAIAGKEFVLDFFNSDMYEQGLKFQKTMMDQYLKAVKNTTDFFQRKPENSEEAASAYEIFTKTTEDMFRSAGEMSESLWKSYNESWEQWKEFFSGSAGFSVSILSIYKLRPELLLRMNSAVSRLCRIS